MQKKLQIGEIIERSKQVEAMLKNIGAEGRGLHEQTSSIQDQLGEELSGKLRFIATIRNKAVHEPEFDIESNMEAFHERCDEIEEVLKKQSKPKRRTRKQKKTPAKEKFNYLFLLPFIPGLNITYFIFLLILSMSCGSGFVVMLMLYLTAGVKIICGIVNHNKEQIYVETGIFAATYIFSFFVKSSRFPKLRYIPLLNLIVIIEQLKNKIHWKLFFTALLLITATVISSFLVFAWEKTFAGIITFSAAYIAGIIVFIYAGKRKNNCKI